MRLNRLYAQGFRNLEPVDLEPSASFVVFQGGPTRLSNLNPVCKYDHREKHRRKLRLEGEGTRKRFVPATEWTGPDPPRRT